MKEAFFNAHVNAQQRSGGMLKSEETIWTSPYLDIRLFKVESKDDISADITHRRELTGDHFVNGF